MLKVKKLALALLVLPFVFSFSLSEAFAQQDSCNVSNLPGNWNYTPAWCQPVVTGEEAVNPGTDWVGTIQPAAPNALCSASSNSGCTLECYVSADGSEVIVPLEPNQCGSFTVTVTRDSPDCGASTASKTVRINNTGQGGSWTVIDCFQGGCPSWPPGPCINNCTGYNMPCPGTPAIYNGKYKIGGGGSCTYAATYQYRGCPGTGCDSGQSGTPDPGGFCPTGELESTICYASPRWDTVCSCVKYGWELCEWKCNTCE